MSVTYVSIHCTGGLGQLMGVVHKTMCAQATDQQEDSGRM